MNAKLGKKYTTRIGNAIQRVIVTDDANAQHEVDVVMRHGRDGLYLYSTAEAKEIAMDQFRPAAVFHVVCTEYRLKFNSRAQALDALHSIEQLGACKAHHVVEVVL